MLLTLTIKDLLDFAVLIILYFALFYKKWLHKGKDVFLINTTMYIYLAFVLYFTLMPILTSLPFIFDHSYTPMNLEPFIDVTNGRGNFTLQLILNVIMTIPFGFLLPLTHKKPSFFKTMAGTFLLSFSIEIIQPLINMRSSDITDIITNVLGGVIGYLLYLVFRPLTMKILRKLQPKSTN